METDLNAKVIKVRLDQQCSYPFCPTGLPTINIISLSSLFTYDNEVESALTSALEQHFHGWFPHQVHLFNCTIKFPFNLHICKSLMEFLVDIESSLLNVLNLFDLIFCGYHFVVKQENKSNFIFDRILCFLFIPQTTKKKILGTSQITDRNQKLSYRTLVVLSSLPFNTCFTSRYPGDLTVWTAAPVVNISDRRMLSLYTQSCNHKHEHIWMRAMDFPRNPQQSSL